MIKKCLPTNSLSNGDKIQKARNGKSRVGETPLMT